MSGQSSRVGRASGGFSGRQMLWTLVGFFGLVFAVNGYFIFAAISTYSGDVAAEPYRKGLNYNARIAAEAQQAKLGWSDALDLTREGHLKLAMKDQGGALVSGLKVTAIVQRPSSVTGDQTAVLASQADGTYVADVKPLAAGTWITSIEARDQTSDELVYRSRRRLWLKP